MPTQHFQMVQKRHFRFLFSLRIYLFRHFAV
jgi:hypothetical protein